MERTRYYQEARDGIYSGPTFVLANALQDLPVSLLATFLSAFVVFRGLKNELLCTENPTTGERSCRDRSGYAQNELDTIEAQGVPNWLEYSYYPDLVTFWLVLWACYQFATQQTVALLMVVKSSYTAIAASVSLTIPYLVLGSGTLRSYAGLPPFLRHLTYVCQTRYSGAVLNDIEFYNRTSMDALQWVDSATGRKLPCEGNNFGFGCR